MATTSVWAFLRVGLACAGLALGLLLAPMAVAREYAPPPASGGLVEHPDGTWSFYEEGGSSPLRTYTSAEHEAIGRLASGLELDTGTTGQTAAVVRGIDSAEV